MGSALIAAALAAYIGFLTHRLRLYRALGDLLGADLAQHDEAATLALEHIRQHETGELDGEHAAEAARDVIPVAEHSAGRVLWRPLA